MRWLVEVSRVGESAASERYCIEARRWQAALQEARRIRGDSGALPKLTIELLDEGYRAVDPQLKVRYVVTEAPAGMAVTEGAQTLLTTYPPPAVSDSQAPAASPSIPAPPAAPSVPASAYPSPPPASSIPPATLASPRPSSPPAVQVIRQREEQGTEANPIEYRELALAVKPGVTRDEVSALLEAKLEEVRAGMPEGFKRYVQIAVFDHMFVKRPVRAPLATMSWKDWRGAPSLDFRGFGDEKRTSSEPPGPALSSRAPSWSGSDAATTAVSAAPLGPLPEILGGTSTAPPRPAAPSTAPAPVLAVGPAPVPDDVPRPSVIPSRVVSVGPSAPSTAPTSAALAAARAAIPLAQQTLPSAPPPTALVDLGLVSSATGPAALSPRTLETAATLLPDRLSAEAARVAEAVRTSSAPAPSVPPAPEASVAPKESPSRTSEPPRSRRSDPGARRADPAVPRRRLPSEDLIGDLFESIHDLSFMVDLVSGADFVATVLSEVIPCEAIVVHAFDLGRREFVVVSARGPNERNALLHRTPDADPIVREVMPRRSLIPNGASRTHTGAFAKLGVEPRTVLSAPARQGGRYLGLIELANPLGGTPFHEGEVSALEYVCEQFAAFVASRPVVLDEDVVLGR